MLLLEKAEDVTQGATKGNSGIVHAGYDDKPGSVRAKYCWPGNQMFPQLDRELRFGFIKNGSLVVAKSKDDEKVVLEWLCVCVCACVFVSSAISSRMRGGSYVDLYVTSGQPALHYHGDGLLRLVKAVQG